MISVTSFSDLENPESRNRVDNEFHKKQFSRIQCFSVFKKSSILRKRVKLGKRSQFRVQSWEMFFRGILPLFKTLPYKPTP